MVSKSRASALLGAVLLVLSVISVEEGTHVVSVLTGVEGRQTVCSGSRLQHGCVHVVLCAGTVEEAATMVSTSADGVKRALVALQSGQVLPLDVAEVALNTTLVITASNVELRGRPETTRMLCPSGRSALTIRGTNVTLRDLEFRGCTTDSAVIVNGTKGDSAVQIGGHGKTKQPDMSIPDVHFHGCVFADNMAPLGAAVRVEDARLRITNTVFENNTGEERGGAIHASMSQMVLSNASFSGNAVINGKGGAIYGSAGNVTVTSGTFTGNQAKDEGGAIYVSADNVTVTNVTFTGNRAEWGSGGAIYVSADNVTVTNVTFTGNQAEWGSGGAIYVSADNVTVTNVTFTGNHAESEGGAICVSTGNVTVTSGTFTGNQAKYEGGAIYGSAGNVTVTSGTFTGNQAEWGDGGAINANEGDVTVTSGTFTGNHAESDGGAICVSAGNVTVTSGTFTGNQAGSDGGAIYGSTSSVTVTSGTFTGNQAEWGSGGAIYGSAGNVTVTSGNFTENQAEWRDGGAIYTSSVALTIEMTLFIANSVGSDKGFGGAVYASGGVNGSSTKIRKTNFSENAARSGGAVVVLGVPSSITDSLFIANAATALGGAVLFVGPAAMSSIVDSYFFNNTVNIEGNRLAEVEGDTGDPFEAWTFGHQQMPDSFQGAGAISIQDIESFKITGSNFTGNRARRGGAIVVNGQWIATELTVAGCRFQGNEANSSGGAVQVNLGGTLILEQNEFRDNSAIAGGAIFLVSNSNLSAFLPPSEQLCFQNNSAVRGGAINCYECVMRLIGRTAFLQNVAMRQGGAVSVVGAGQ